MSWLVLFIAVCIAVGAVLWRFHVAEKRTVVSLQHRIAKQELELRQVRDTSDARNLFLAALSHELRTPLSGITGAIHLLQETDLNSRQQEYARMVAYASSTVLEIVDDMLTFSRIQAHKISIENTMFSVREVIDDMLSLQSIKAQANGLVLVRDVSADVPEQLIGDRGKLNQILLNVIGNAIKFTDEGFITVTVALAATGAAASGSSLYVDFIVSDTGIGIAASDIDKIFKPFVQGDAVTGAVRGGTGLGLAICQRLVDAMGGDIHLDSRPGVGTTVRFRLAFLLGQSDAAAPASVPIQKDVSLQPSLMVLVIEDDEINRLVCTRYLALAGHHPLAAANEDQVFLLMQTTSHIPDVILLDMNLAGQSGVELLEHLKAKGNRHWENVPVIAMSADISGAAQRQAQDNGMMIFLPKPFTASQLNVALNSVVKKTDDQADLLPVGSDTSILLDEQFLNEEVGDLGIDVLFELLNIFRASAATRLVKMTEAVSRLDWQSVADHAHAFQGSAANLGMRQVVLHARALQQVAADECGQMPDQVQLAVADLEMTVHAGADAVRAFLLIAGQKDVTLAVHGDD